LGPPEGEGIQRLLSAECSEMQARVSLANAIVMATVLPLLPEISNSALGVIPCIQFVMQYCSPSNMLKTSDREDCKKRETITKKP